MIEVISFAATSTSTAFTGAMIALGLFYELTRKEEQEIQLEQKLGKL